MAAVVVVIVYWSLVLQNTVPPMCISEMKDWSKVALETDPCVGVTRRALSDIWEKIKLEVNRLSKSGVYIFIIFIIYSLNISDINIFLFPGRTQETREIHG